MRRYLLYWLRAVTLGAGLNFMVVSHIMNNTDKTFAESAPFGAMVSVNCSFLADRIIFRADKKKQTNKENA